MGRTESTSRSDVIDQLVASYLKIPLKIYWRETRGLPFPDTFIDARLEFAGMTTSWLRLDSVIWRAGEVRFVPGFPARLYVRSPSVEFVVGQAELDRWQSRFALPYRLELTESGITVHTELAGFPLAEFETGLAVVDGWFVLEPKRATVLGVPGYVSSLFRGYLPVPPLSGEIRLAGIEHAAGILRVRFDIEDFDEEVTPGMLSRLQKRLFSFNAPLSRASTDEA